MLRFCFVILVNFFNIIYYVPKMAHYGRHLEKYSEEECYALARKLISKVQRAARVKTEHYGVENIPSGNGGYIMFSNHQGKYDALGILAGHDRPCTLLMDKKRSKLPIADQFISLLRAQRIDKESLRQQITVLKTIAKEVTEGRVYLIFPEGGYEKDQGNRTAEFKQGCFLCAIHAKCPIVPVVIVDSYKVFGKNSLKKATTKVIYLPPVPYEKYCNMRVPEISDMIKGIIDAELEKWAA